MTEIFKINSCIEGMSGIECRLEENIDATLDTGCN